MLVKNRKMPAISSDTLIERILPEYEFRDEISVPVKAPASALLSACRRVTLEEMPIAAWLGKVRYWPGRLRGRTPEAPRGVPFFQQLLASGNVILAEGPHEIVLGSIGKFHQLFDQRPIALQSANEFLAFGDPAYQKLVMSLRVEETVQGRRLVLEHRTHALSPSARKAFAWYWLVIEPGGHFVSWLLLRAVRRRAAAAGGPLKWSPV